MEISQLSQMNHLDISYMWLPQANALIDQIYVDDELSNNISQLTSITVTSL